MNSIYNLFHFLFVKWKSNTTILFIVISIVAIATCVFFKIKFKWKLRKACYLFLIIEYIVLVFLSTVFTRRILEVPRVEVALLWSYRWGYKVYGWKTVLLENGINIVLLMPIAILLMLFMKNGRHGLLVLIICLLISSCIELLQYFMRRGTLEIDDILHNMAGVALVILFNSIIRKRTIGDVHDKL